MSSLSGRHAIVTGSTSGIGHGIAEVLAAHGCDITLNGLGDAADIEKLRSGMASKHGVNVRYSNADMTKPDQIRAMVADAEKEAGHVDILVNNAGIQYTAPVEEFPSAKWDAIIAINLSASFHSIAAAVPGMRKRGFGRIINIASAHGLVASIHKAAYVSAKHGLVGLTKVVALETARDPITCNAICPGWVLTPLVQKQIEDRAAEEGKSIEDTSNELLAEKQPSMQFVTPEQLGGFAVFLSSDSAAQLTGQALAMDGGWTAQ